MTGALPAGCRVTLFCGGRGGATLARTLVTRETVDLALVVNGYDNGHSTGALRRFVPDMLGVSDFRKNLRHHLDPARPDEAALLWVLDHRLPARGADRALLGLLHRLEPARPESDRLEPGGLEPGGHPVDALLPGDRDAIARHLASFAAHHAARDGTFDLTDASLANLVMAGAHLRLDRDFNRALVAFRTAFRSPVHIHNISNGENAFLVALKQNGELLVDEADIVAPQCPSPILHVFLLPQPIEDADRRTLAALARDDQVAWLRAHSIAVSLNPEANRAVTDADLLVFGPGTQYSSLLPTYLTRGLAESVRASRARAKVFVANLGRDHDARQLDVPDLLDRTLETLGDPHNTRGTVTHVLYQHRRRRSADAPGVPARIEEAGHHRGARWVAADVEHGVHTGVHDGPATVSALAGILRAAVREGDAERA